MNDLNEYALSLHVCIALVIATVFQFAALVTSLPEEIAAQKPPPPVPAAMHQSHSDTGTSATRSSLPTTGASSAYMELGATTTTPSAPSVGVRQIVALQLMPSISFDRQPVCVFAAID